jgi:hypothetical protein
MVRLYKALGGGWVSEDRGQKTDNEKGEDRS